MKLGYSKSFLKDVQNLNDKAISEKLKEILIKCKEINVFNEIPNLKKLRRHKTAYRIRVGDYRAGFYFENDELFFVRFLHRKEIYRYFP